MSTPTPTPNSTPEAMDNLNVDLDKRREQKQEIERIIPEIERANEICQQLTENIEYEKQKLKTIKTEIKLSANRWKDLESQYRAITEKDTSGSKHQVEAIKTQIIKEKLEELISEKIPELGLTANKNRFEQKDNEFKNLIHSAICVTYTQYDLTTSQQSIKEETQNFLISNTSQFNILKVTACHFWGIDNYSDYLITDDCEAIIYNEEAVINDYMKNYSVRTNVVRLINANVLKMRMKLLPWQQDRIEEENKFTGKVKGEINKRQDRSSNGLNTSEFLKYFNGLKPYFLIRDDKQKIKNIEDSKKQARKLSSSFWMFLLVIILFSLSLSVIYSNQKSIILSNKRKKYFEFLFDPSKVRTNAELASYIYSKIFQKLLISDDVCTDDNKNNINKFNENKRDELSFPNCTDTNNTNTELVTALQKREIPFDVVSPIHFVLNKVKSVSCDDKEFSKLWLEQSDICYEENHNPGTRFEEDLVIPDNNNNNFPEFTDQIKKYKSSKEAGVSFNIQSNSDYFQGDGYHMNIPLSTSLSHSLSFIFSWIPAPSNETNIDDYFLISSNTKALTIWFNVYFANENIFANVVIHFTFSFSGFLDTPILEVRSFSPSYAKGGISANNIIRFILLVIIIGWITVDYLIRYKDRTSLLKKFFSVSYLHYILIFILFLSSFIIQYNYLNKNDSKFFGEKKENYENTYEIAKHFEYFYYLEAILVLFIGFKLLTFLKILNLMGWIVSTIQITIVMFVQYFIAILTILFGFTVISSLIWGPHIPSFYSFGRSFISILLFSTGFFNVKELIQYNEGWAVVFTIWIIFFDLFLLVPVFISLFAESVRRSVVKSGYPEDREVVEWTLKDYITWFVHFTPQDDDSSNNKIES